MPELPEVETVARQLAPQVEGRKLVAVRLRDPLLKCAPGAKTPRGALGRRIQEVRRHGKQVLFSLENGDGARPLHLGIHLRMTGRLSYVADVPRRIDRLRARLDLDRGAVLFLDVRRFGTLRWCADPEELAPGAVDPTSVAFTSEHLAALIGDSRQEIKPWLLRQDRLVGLGNIYCSEILHVARIDPRREARDLKAQEIDAVHRATVDVLARAIENCGTTFSDFQDAHGVTGSYQEYLAVYGREGEPCPRCGAEVSRIVQQQRSTFYCSGCAS